MAAHRENIFKIKSNIVINDGIEEVTITVKKSGEQIPVPEHEADIVR